MRYKYAVRQRSRETERQRHMDWEKHRKSDTVIERQRFRKKCCRKTEDKSTSVITFCIGTLTALYICKKSLCKHSLDVFSKNHQQLTNTI